MSPVQTVRELNFIKSNNPNIFLIPLSLETLIHCRIKGINFYDPKNYLGNYFHETALVETEKFTNSIPLFSEIVSLQSEIVAALRFFFHQIIFIEYLLKNILDEEKISYILVSGWNINSPLVYSTENYFTSRIVERFFGSRVKKINSVYQKTSAFVYDYQFKKTNKIEVLVNSFGYNFRRLSKACKRKGISASAILYNKLTNKQRIGAWLRGNNYLVNEPELKSFSEAKISVILNDIVRESLINERVEEIMPHFQTQLNKCRLIDKFLENMRPAFSASYSMRGIDGYLLERSHQLNIPSIAIPHGTIAPAFNNNDKIYKNIIGEAVFSGECTYVALQSKITKASIKTQTLKGEPIQTGNLIFSEVSQRKKNDILYAVTLKDFSGMQFFGVEMYYEFMESLSCLTKLQEATGLNVNVKLHPSASNSKDNLQILFPMLRFTTKKLSTCLKNSLLTISYSSTVIEDSLCSRVPVILFDQWKRYKHCHSETNPSVNNKAVYYVTSFDELVSTIETVSSSSNIDFTEYTVPGESSKNFESLLENYI